MNPAKLGYKPHLCGAGPDLGKSSFQKKRTYSDEVLSCNSGGREIRIWNRDREQKARILASGLGTNHFNKETIGHLFDISKLNFDQFACSKTTKVSKKDNRGILLLLKAVLYPS